MKKYRDISSKPMGMSLNGLIKDHIFSVLSWKIFNFLLQKNSAINLTPFQEYYEPSANNRNGAKGLRFH